MKDETGRHRWNPGPIKGERSLPLTCLGSQFCPKSFISVLYNARQLSKLMPSRFIRLTWSDFSFTKPKLLASARSLYQRKKPILTQNIHTFMKVCKWFLVWIHIENAPNSFETSSVLQSGIKLMMQIVSPQTLLLLQQFFTMQPPWFDYHYLEFIPKQHGGLHLLWEQAPSLNK